MPIEEGMTRICKSCQRALPIQEHFYRATSKSGWAITCKSCVKNKQRVRRALISRTARTRRQQKPKRTKLSEEAKSLQLWSLKRHKKRAHYYGVEASLTAYDVRLQYDQQQGRCYYCDVPMQGAVSIDHVVALATGGDHTASNVVLCCHRCNSRKHTKDAAQFFLETLAAQT